MLYSLKEKNTEQSVNAVVDNNKLFTDGVADNQTDRPAISVIIPLYNKAENVIDTINSVLAQSFNPLEIIIVDDGSTDGGAERVSEIFADRVTLISQVNAGVSAARNRGIEAAKGDYVALLDADDFWAAHYLEEVAALIKLHPEAGTVATSYQYCDGEQDFKSPKIRFAKTFFKPGIMDCYFSVAANGDLPFNASSVVLKKSLLESLKGFPLNEPMGEDQDVWSRAALRAPIAYSPKVLSFYNRGGENRACESKPPAAECPFSRRLYTYALNANIDAQTRDNIIDYTVTHLLQLAKRNIQFGDFAAARALLADKRCRRKPLKRLREYLRLAAAIASAKLGMLLAISIVGTKKTSGFAKSESNKFSVANVITAAQMERV
jgi:glycosyltransferase involved in cell wall biosynthesis